MMYALVEEKTIYKYDYSIYYEDIVLKKATDPDVLLQHWNAHIEEQQEKVKDSHPNFRNAIPDKMGEGSQEVRYTKTGGDGLIRCRVVIKQYKEVVLH